MDKKIHTLLTTLFFQVDDNVAFRDLDLRLSSSRTRPIPVEVTKKELRRVDGLTRHMTVNGILYSRTSQTTVRCAAPHPWIECILLQAIVDL